MKVYVSGQITGLDETVAAEMFAQAANDIKFGSILFGDVEVINPMELPHLHEGKWIDYMCEDIRALHDCQMIYMLPNWRDSKGARIEHAIAEILGLDIYYDEIGTHEENNISESV